MTETASGGLAIDTASLSPLHWVAFGLAAITGVLHLWLGVQFVTSPVGISFLLAGIGFFVGAALVAVDYRRRLVYAVGIPFTAVQIVAWYLVNAPDFSPLGYLDKAVQVVFVVVLVVLYRREG
ncbi:hypothetical protein BV210_09480 [Halorientalis sp. IM1011]|uniref:DUF7475 family protein n=1 Tax=Halorientalis sp. IM1011 TaxID=1932360 RepID=UPI00097CD58D|nr:hypothetical protein [Halorientalis sp. IM1011]AQL42932.1 hypothetical protein BV210_09480 [Halorientalis sp. IM1011]